MSSEDTDTPAPDAKAQSDILVLPAKSSIDHLEDVMAALKASGTEPGLKIDASAVEKISTPIILAILSAATTRLDLKPPATLINPSSEFVDAFTDLGFFQDLMKMEFAS